MDRSKLKIKFIIYVVDLVGSRSLFFYYRVPNHLFPTLLPFWIQNNPPRRLKKDVFKNWCGIVWQFPENTVHTIIIVQFTFTICNNFLPLVKGKYCNIRCAFSTDLNFQNLLSSKQTTENGILNRLFNPFYLSFSITKIPKARNNILQTSLQTCYIINIKRSCLHSAFDVIIQPEGGLPLSTSSCL